MRIRLGLALVLVATAAPLAAFAQSLDSARAFVTGLYQRYGRSEPDYAGKDAPTTFTANVIRLIHEDQVRAGGKVPDLDGDPICDCQDPGGLKLLGVSVFAAGPARATAVARVKFPDAVPVVIRLDLVAAGGGWRIADVHSADTPSLVQLLQPPKKK